MTTTIYPIEKGKVMGRQWNGIHYEAFDSPRKDGYCLINPEGKMIDVATLDEALFLARDDLDSKLDILDEFRLARLH